MLQSSPCGIHLSVAMIEMAIIISSIDSVVQSVWWGNHKTATHATVLTLWNSFVSGQSHGLGDPQSIELGVSQQSMDGGWGVRFGAIRQ